MGPGFDLSFLRDRVALKRIAGTTFVCAVLGLSYAVLSPKWYRSVLTVVPAKQQRSGVSSLLGGEIGALAAGLDVGGGTDAPRIAAVLQSIAVTDAVIEKLDLRTRYRGKYQETARETLWRHCNVATLPKPNLVQLSCEDQDPRFAQQMLEYFAEYGNQVFRRVSVSSASEEVRFLDKRVVELRREAADAATRMREFQERHRIVDLDTQAKAVVSAMAALNSQRISRQVELDYARSFTAGDEATTRQLRSQLSAVGQGLRDLEEPRQGEERRERTSGGLFPAALAVPALREEFEGLLRDRKVSEATLIFALERLEAAKANEARDVSTFLVLDPPTLPVRHSRPKRTLAVAASALLGFLGSFGFEWSRRVGGRPAAGTLAGRGRSSDSGSVDDSSGA